MTLALLGTARQEEGRREGEGRLCDATPRCPDAFRGRAAARIKVAPGPVPLPAERGEGDLILAVGLASRAQKQHSVCWPVGETVPVNVLEAGQLGRVGAPPKPTLWHGVAKLHV